MPVNIIVHAPGFLRSGHICRSTHACVLDNLKIHFTSGAASTIVAKCGFGSANIEQDGSENNNIIKLLTYNHYKL